MKKVLPNPKKHKKEILSWIAKNKRLPKQDSKNALECTLYSRLRYYFGKTYSTYDPKFKKELLNKVKKLGITLRKRDSNLNPKLVKRDILKWAEKYGKLPSRLSEDKKERKLACRMENYLSKKSKSFDPEFRNIIYSKYPRKVNNKRDHDKEQRIREAIEFVKENNRVPFHSEAIDSTPEERLMRSIISNYTSPSSPLYNEDLVKTIKNIDKCYLTGIPVKYRRCINNALDGSKLKEEVL